MEGRFNQQLYNFLLVQKSINHAMPYDAIEAVIHDSIHYVKSQNINARISNVVFNINGKLVLAQVYVERKNAFATTEDNRFGTSPTSYNVQVRFPFGLETSLGQQTIVLPRGDFHRALQPYKSYNGKVLDDVMRDTDPTDIVLGPGIDAKLDEEKKQVALSIPRGESVTFSYQDVIGIGYAVIQPGGLIEYYHLEDWNARLKMNGVYPLFYSPGAESKAMILRQHSEYPGHTQYQRGVHEPRAGKQQKLAEYKTFLAAHSDEITRQSIGKRWAASSQQHAGRYVLDISIVNGVTLYTQSGMPVTRLRDYQLELFQSCLAFVDQVESKASLRGRAGKINMGVGAGKTFFTFTFLQHLKHKMQSAASPARIKPPFCMAPDIDVANVTKRTIDRQGVTSGTSATAITKREHMPNPAFLAWYEGLSTHAQQAAKVINDYIQTGLQNDILKFCAERSTHPLTFMNVLYSRGEEHKLQVLKDSMDVKRLLLMVEGQKTILNKTGMLGIEALSNLLEQFTAVREGISRGYEFKEAKATPSKLPTINYNQTVHHPRFGALNITQLTVAQLRSIFTEKWTMAGGVIHLAAIRDHLMRMAFLANKNAAILLANSGGLGNTYTEAELRQQIDEFLPIAVEQLTTLANKQNPTCHDHYVIYLYLREIFPNIPDAINPNAQMKYQEMFQTFQDQLLQESINNNIELVRYIERRIAEKIKQLGTVADFKLPEKASADSLQQWGIQASDNPIRAANQLAGIASLGITGHATVDEAKLLLTHVPVFTPEGLASYFEYLERLEGQPKISFKEEFGVYKTNRQQRVISKTDIRERLQQVLTAVMIADEVHKEEFSFLYDPSNSIHQRIDGVTRRCLGQAFRDVLPPRIGMSGTINQVSDRAFGDMTLYHLSTQTMIQQGLLKQISIVTQPVIMGEKKEDSKAESDQQKKNKQAYAKQVVADYFVQNTHLSIRNVLSGQGYAVDVFKVSKGLIFSKISDPELNQYIEHYFNLLIQEKLSHEEGAIQAELFHRINQRRAEQARLLRDKLHGKEPLTAAECIQIEIHNRAHPQKLVPTKSDAQGLVTIDTAIARYPVEEKSLNPQVLRQIHRDLFLNNLFAIYLEYVLSKSSAPKEFSDIIGLQNQLHENGQNLMEGIQHEQTLLALIAAVDPKSMTAEDITVFIQARIKDVQLANIMVDSILTCKNRPRDIASYLQAHTTQVSLNRVITSNRHEFESGKTFAMLGSKSEQTGYSHEPVGIIVDVASDMSAVEQTNYYIDLLREGKLQQTDMGSWVTCLQALAAASFSYDEKNQAGGRALRTPYGHVKYVQYQSRTNVLFAESKINVYHPLAALKVETQFEDIFTANEALAQEERASITFNRYALSQLDKPDLAPAAFYQAVATHFAEQCSNEQKRQQYVMYIHQRLPLLWSMKYQPELAHAYFLKPDPHIFDNIKPDFTALSFKIAPAPLIPEKKTMGLSLFLRLPLSLTLRLLMREKRKKWRIHTYHKNQNMVILC